MKKIYFLLLSILAFAMTACEENTGSLGISADMDQVSNSDSIYSIYTRSVLIDKGIIANNSSCYLGRMTDPETGCMVEADFAAQYQTFENYGFPKKDLMVDASDKDNVKMGVPKCDSCDVRLYFDSYYGDASNPMKLQVFALSSDPNKIMREDSVYYTDVDLTRFLDQDSEPLASRMFSVNNYEVDEDERNNYNYSKNIHVVLPASFGQNIMDKFYENPDYFKDSYQFTHNVVPGLYFRCKSGNGTMVKVYVGTLNVYFKYKENSGDSIYSAMARFAATPEVIQSTSFRNSDNMKTLFDDATPYTYLKTPAGIATEMTLPIDEVFSGKHEADSVSKASVTITRYNKEQIPGQLNVPSELLMVRKTEMEDFFRKRMVSDARTSYTTTFSSVYNTYTFSNIARLLSYCKHEKIEAVKKRLADKGITEYTQDQFVAEESQWMKENPDWNKVLLVPVVTSTTTKQTSNGLEMVQVSVNHDMGLNSVKLVGGSATPIQLQVVYSRFK